MTPEAVLDVVVTDKEVVAQDVVTLTLQRSDGGAFPAWDPGAHVDLLVTTLAPRLHERQYSLISDPGDDRRWRIAVLREAEGSGTSVFVHDDLAVGDEVQVRGPRNHFALVPSPSYLFISGGIGITPLLAMVAQAERSGADWQLVHCGRRDRSHAFASELEPYGERVRLHSTTAAGPLDLAALLERPRPDTLVYCCGPERLIEGVSSSTAHWPAGALHVERFTARPVGQPVLDEPFEVILSDSDITLTVPTDTSVLAVLEAAGISVFTSCEEGTCGTCETAVLEGVPDHRDSVLTDSERAAGDCMMVCVSRSCTPQLVLEL